jgi:hypothetical protein
MSFKVPWTSDFLIRGLEEVDQYCGPREIKTLWCCIFLNGDLPKISFCGGNPRCMSSARENSYKYSTVTLEMFQQT